MKSTFNVQPANLKRENVIREHLIRENVIRDTYSFGLTGYPLGHSLSPQIHAAALHGLGLNGEYSLYPIPPSPTGEKTLQTLLSQMRAGQLHGLNVTIPHKQTVVPLLDGLTLAAQTIGAVNTIFWDGERLVGDNTDAPGFWADLERLAYSVKRRETNAICNMQYAIILGAGGSARAVACALLSHGWHATLAARRIEQAQEISEQLSVGSYRGSVSCVQLSVAALTDWSLITDHCSLIVNTTPVGMTPHMDESPWPLDVPFPKDAAVYDLVYNPSETLLVKNARAAGLPATTGSGMLIEQAALSFERWTGIKAPRDVMRAAVESASR